MSGPAVARPRWGVQTGLFQLRQPAFWLFLSLLLLSGALFLLMQGMYVVSAPLPWTLSWVLLLLYIVPVVLVVRWLDLYEREPRSLLIASFLWGGVVAIAFSGFGNLFWGSVVSKVFGPEFAAEWSAALTAPVVEEIYKVLGVVLIALIARPEMDDLMDGFVFGALIGLGFSVVEDVDYFLSAFGGGVGGVLEGFWVRVIASGLYGHVLYTGLSGLGVAYAIRHRHDRPLGRRLAVALGLLLLAIAAHFLWNSPLIWRELPLLAATTVKGLPFLLVLGIALRLARRREHGWLEAALAPEVGGPGVLREELANLADPRRAKQARRQLRDTAGPDAERILRRLQRAQVDLALVSTRADRADDPDLVRQRDVCAGLRRELLAHPGGAAALGIAAETAERISGMRVDPPWQADVQAPSAGLAAWPGPDGAVEPTTRIDQGVPLMAVERQGDWARVRAANGWTGWVDARQLVPRRRTYWR